MTFLFLFTLGLICWFFSTVAAGGGATILIPFVAFFLGVQMVAPVVSVAALIANPTRVYTFRKNINWQIICYLLPGSIIGAIIGAWSFSKANTQIIQIILGLFLISYTLENTLRKSTYTFKMKLSWFFPLGVVVSFLSGLIGATGPIQNPFMLNYGVTKEYLVGTKAIKEILNIAKKKFKLKKIIAGTYSNNFSSQKVLLKNGFKLEGTLKKYFLYKKKRVDHLIFGKVL